MRCTSCKKDNSKSINFPCPKCGEKISRCDKCRSLAIEYKCPKCGYKGP